MPVIRTAGEIPLDNGALSRVTEKIPYKSLEESLDAFGAGPNDVARVIGSVLNCGSNEHVKLKAAQLAVEFRNQGSKKSDNRIIFNLVGNNITLNNLIVQE